MKVEDYHTAWNITKPADIEVALSKRHGAGRNAFWLSHGSNEFPAINIMVNGDLAYVHYFPEAHHPGFASVGTVPSLKSGRDTDFFLSNSNEPLGIMNEAVVCFSDALKAAQEFAIFPALPKSIQWSEL
jgi:hypothetical protein